MPFIDLSHSFTDGMFGLTTLPPIRVTQMKSVESDGVSVTHIDCAVHSGTHIDAPSHFIQGGEDIAALSLERVSGPAAGFKIECGPDQEISAAQLAAAGAQLKPHDIALICTGWSRFFHSDPDAYRRHPYLSVEAARWLLDKEIKMVAMDIPSPDRPVHLRPPGFDFPVHHLLLGGGVLVGEHLNNLESVAGRRCTAFAFPLKIEGSDGSPVRFIAEV